MEHFLVGFVSGGMAFIALASFGFNAFGIACAAFILVFTPYIYESFKH